VIGLDEPPDHDNHYAQADGYLQDLYKSVLLRPSPLHRPLRQPLLKL